MDSEIGRDMFEIKKGKTAGRATGRDGFAESEFTSQDKDTMNARLDEILAKLERISLENEAIWTDMKADFEEMRNLFHLGKKNWLQLLMGKMTDWVGGGVVSEIISKPIADTIKPIAQELMGWESCP